MCYLLRVGDYGPQVYPNHPKPVVDDDGAWLVVICSFTRVFRQLYRTMGHTLYRFNCMNPMASPPMRTKDPALATLTD